MRDSRKAFGLTREARIMAESGAIYAVTVILIIATYTRDSNSFNVFLDMASPVIGVAVSGPPSLPFCPSKLNASAFSLVLPHYDPPLRELERPDAHLHAGHGPAPPRGEPLRRRVYGQGIPPSERSLKTFLCARGNGDVTRVEGIVWPPPRFKLV